MNEPESRKRGRPRAFNEDLEGKVVQSLDKALIVLKTVSGNAGLSLTEISEITDIPAPTVYRALITMQLHDLVTFDDVSQLWTVGVGAFRVGSSFLTKTNIVEQARPVMHSLMIDMGETANLGILENREVVFLSQVETHEPIRAFHRPGSRGSIHASGIGKILFSCLDETSANQVISSATFEEFTDNTITNIDALKAMRLVCRKIGYSVDDEERTLGMRCVAAPIYNVYAEAVAAISISGPCVRMPKSAIETIASKVKTGADLITENIGGNRPQD